MLEIRNGCKAFKEQVIFDCLDFKIENAGMYFIQGESGSGKTTLLNLLAGFEPFDSGEINIDQNLATIFQNYELIPGLSVKDNISLTKKKWSSSDQNLIEKLGIEELMEYYPNELSGGQKQRVGIARALLLNPNIILCDEPTESLDIENKRIVMDLLKELAKEKIVIVASHEQALVDEYAHIVYKLEDKKLVSDRKMKEKLQLKCNEIEKKGIIETLFFIFKILAKKTIFVSILILLVSMLVEGLFIFENKMFYVPTTTNTVNADMIYIEKNDAGVKLENYIKNVGLRPYIKFQTVRIGGVKAKADIFPYQKNKLQLEGKEPGKNEVLVNQHVLDMLGGKWQDKSLQFTYVIGSMKYDVTLNVCGVVNETDSNEPAFYYDYDSMMETVSESGIVEGDIVEYLTYFGTTFEKPYGYSSIGKLIEDTKDLNAFSIYNPLYEQRLEFKNSSVVYRVLFKILEAILLIGILIFIIVYVFKDTSYYLAICAILASVQFPLPLIKGVYFFWKLILFIPFELIAIDQLTAYHRAQYASTYLTRTDYALINQVVWLIVVVYFVVLVVSLTRLKKERVSEILKESKDMI